MGYTFSSRTFEAMVEELVLSTLGRCTGHLSVGGGLGSNFTPARHPSAILALRWAIAAGCRERVRGWMGGGLSTMSAAGCEGKTTEHQY